VVLGGAARSSPAPPVFQTSSARSISLDQLAEARGGLDLQQTNASFVRFLASDRENCYSRLRNAVVEGTGLWSRHDRGRRQMAQAGRNESPRIKSPSWASTAGIGSAISAGGRSHPIRISRATAEHTALATGAPANDDPVESGQLVLQPAARSRRLMTSSVGISKPSMSLR